MKKIFLFHDYESGFLCISEDGVLLKWFSDTMGFVGDQQEQDKTHRKLFLKVEEDLKNSFPKYKIICPEKGDIELIESIKKYRDIAVKDHNVNPFDFEGLLRRVSNNMYNTYKYR